MRRSARSLLLAGLFFCYLMSSCTERQDALNKPDVEVANGFNDQTRSVSFSDASTHLERLQNSENSDIRNEAIKLRWNNDVEYGLAIQGHPDSNLSNFIEKNLRRVSANAPIEIRKSKGLENVINQQTSIRLLFVTDRSQLLPFSDAIEIGKLESSSKIDGLGCSMEQWIATGDVDQPNPIRNIIFVLDPDFPDPESLVAPHYALRRVKDDNMKNMFWQRRCFVWTMMNSMGLAISSPDLPTELSSAYDMRGAESALTRYDLAALQLFYDDNE